MPRRRSASSFCQAAGLAWMVLTLAACAEGPVAVEWTQGDGYRWTPLVAAEGEAGFAPLSAEDTGLSFVNTLTDDAIAANNHYLNGSGIALGDVDGDGWTDVYVGGLDTDNRLYRNLGGEVGRWQFEDITEAAGVAAPGRYTTGTAFADLDGDDDLDLLVAAMDGPNAVFFNDGTGRFTERTEDAGLTLAQGSTSWAIADVEGDGDLDLYLVNYKAVAVNALYPPEARTYERTIVREGDTFRIAPEFADHYVLEERDGGLIRFEYAEPDVFYRNDGSGRFAAVPFAEAFRDAQGQPLTEAPPDWGLAARFHDLNGDGHPDLYVCNDYQSPDRLWLGDGQGGFQAAPPEALRKTSLSTMSVDVSDVDRDGHPDLFLADMRLPTHADQQARIGLTVPKPYRPGDLDVQAQEIQNALLLNRGDGTFAETAFQAGVAATGWTWGSAFVDVDLDGYEDLLLTNGHAFDLQLADAQEAEMARLATMPASTDYRRLIFDYPALPLPNAAFRNQGDGTFAAVADGWGLGRRPDVATSLALADLDHDGDADVVMSRLNEPLMLFEQTGAAARVAVQLRGQAPNTQSIGATIRVLGGPVLQTKEVAAGGGYLTHSAPRHAFAAGTADTLHIEVTWRSGARRTVVARPGRLYEIEEPAGRPPARQTMAEDTRPASFVDESELLAHRHAAKPFDDFAAQPLLPWRLTEHGPPVRWADLDGDGDPDLLLGGSGDALVDLYRNDDGRLTSVGALGRTGQATGEPTGLAVLPRPAGAVVLVPVSNARSQGRALSYLQALTLDQGLRVVSDETLPFGSDAIGTLTLLDADSDGDLDVFAAGRYRPGRYPEPASSVLYRNNAGRLERADDWSMPFRSLGLVQDVATGDLDGDGHDDLAMATHWGAIRVFTGDGAGGFIEATEAMGLAALTGWWNAVHLADFDEDGRPDLVAGNAGWNTVYGPSRPGDAPLRLYSSDYNADGTLDPVLARYDSDVDAYVPEASLQTLGQAMPYVRSRMPTYQQYAQASLEQIIGPKLARGDLVEAATRSHLLLRNTAAGFVATALPPLAQQSSVNAVASADYDGDGHRDLYLAQNTMGFPDAWPRLDAGQGLWLRGDGAGGFIPVRGLQSGVRVYGAQYGTDVADYDGDGRPDLVVTQYGSATRLFRNQHP